LARLTLYTSIERAVATTIYHAAIVHCLVHHDKKTSQHSYDKLDESFALRIARQQYRDGCKVLYLDWHKGRMTMDEKLLTREEFLAVNSSERSSRQSLSWLGRVKTGVA